MLSSIHPLGERARHNRWAVTVAAFTFGAAASGSLVGLVLGLIGSTVFAAPAGFALAATASLALVAGLLDWRRVRPPGPARQVNETWIGAFRGWVYGGAFGVELGAGFLTYVVTWGVYASLAAALFTLSPLAGALVGAVFGLGRSLSLWVGGYVDRPSRLTSFNRKLANAGPVVRVASTAILALVGGAVIAGGAL